MSLELDKTYLRAIVDTSAFATPGKPEGFSNHNSASSADNVIIRQNNTIIALLLEINSKLDVLVYVDDILVFSRDLQEHLGHLQTVFRLFLDQGIIISKKKMELCKTHINFLGITLGEGKIKLQPHIAKKVLEMPDKLDKTKDLQKFLGLVNYAKNFIKDLGKIAGPLYSKTGGKGQKFFNTEDIKLVRQIKEKVKTFKLLEFMKHLEHTRLLKTFYNQFWKEKVSHRNLVNYLVNLEDHLEYIQTPNVERLNYGSINTRI